MKKTATIVTSCWLAFASFPAAEAQDYFLITLRGAYEVPQNNSLNFGGGNAAAMGSVLCYDIFVAGVEPTAAAIYGPAPRRSNGPFIAALTNDASITPYPGAIEYGGCIELTDEQVAELNAGLWYVEIASATYPFGELRGQICPLTDDGDCDNDGVPNIQDGCARTPPGWPVDFLGCTILDEIPCNGPWKNHKDYVKSFREAVMRLWKEGKLTVSERNDLIRQAEASDCGNSSRPYEK